MTSFLFAFRFLTILPLGRENETLSVDPGKAALFFPLVGMFVGVLLAGFYAAVKNFLPVPLTAGLVVSFWLLLTGGLHMDGLMDTFDGIGLRGSQQEKLAAMKDSRSGAMAVQAALVVILLKALSIFSFPDSMHLFPYLLLAPVTGRAAMVALMAVTPATGNGKGMGSFFSDATGDAHLYFAFIFTALTGVLLIGLNFIYLLVLQLLVFIWLRKVFIDVFGGITGDMLGAACEIHELSFLIFGLLIIGYTG